MCEICSELTIETPERRHLVFLLTYIISFSSVSFVGFEQVNVVRVGTYELLFELYISVSEQ